MKKTIKAYAIMPAFPDSEEVELYPFMTRHEQLEIYLTKKAAERANENMDEAIVSCEIVFDNSGEKLKGQ